MGTRFGWIISYKSLYFVHLSLELVPLFTGMRGLLVAILDSTESSSVPLIILISALGYRKSSVKPPLSNIPAISYKSPFSGEES